MSYKRYWVALAIVILGSFAVLGGVGRKMISEAPPIPMSTRQTDSCSSPAVPSLMVRASGSRSAARRSAQSGATAPMSRPTGAPTGCIANRRFCLTAGRKRRRGEFRCARPGPAGRFQGAPDSRDAHQHLRCSAQSRHLERRSRRGVRSACAPTTPTSLQRAAQSTRSPAARLTNTAKQNQLAAFFWWTRGPPARSVPAPKQPTRTTGRMSRWLPTTPTRAQCCGASSASSACWPASAGWSGGTHRRKRAESTALILRSDPFLGFQPTPSQRATIKYFLVVVDSLGRADSDGRAHCALWR